MKDPKDFPQLATKIMSERMPQFFPRLRDALSQGIEVKASELLPEEREKFEEILLNEVIPKYFENMEHLTNPPDWMKILSQVELKNRIDELMKSPDANEHFSSVRHINQVLNGVRVLQERYEYFIFVKGRQPKDYQEIDEFLQRPKTSKPKKEYNEADFQIDKWGELLIELYDDDNEWFRFTKLYDKKLSHGESFKWRYSDMGWGGVVRTFLEIAQTSNREGSFVFHKRHIKSRVDKSLRAFFRLDEQSIISLKGRPNHYYPMFKICRYDKNGNLYGGHIFSNEFKELPESL